MRRFRFFVIMMVVLLIAGVSFAEECTTVGAKDCRRSNQPGVCYWWECQQTGSVKQMIFLGQKCTCPQSKLDTGTAGFARSGDETAAAVCVQAVSR